MQALLWSTLKVRETHHVPKSLPPLHLNAAMVRVFIIVFLSAFAGALIEPIYLLFLREKFELHPLLLAWAFLPAGLVFAFVPTYAGRWADRVGRRRVIVLGFVVAGLVSMGLWGAMIGAKRAQISAMVRNTSENIGAPRNTSRSLRNRWEDLLSS